MQCLADAMLEEDSGADGVEQNLYHRHGIRGGTTPMERWSRTFPEASEYLHKRQRLAVAKSRDKKKGLAS